MAKEDLNLGGSTAASFISSLRTGISSIRQEMNLLKQDTSGWSSALGGAMSRLGGRGGGYGSPGNNVVAPVPVFKITSLGEAEQVDMYRQGGYNRVFSSPGIEPYRPLPTGYMGDGSAAGGGGGGGGGFGALGRRAITGGVVGGIASLPNAREAVEYELATKRMIFYQQQASFQAGNAGPFGKTNPFGIYGLGTSGGQVRPGGEYATATTLLQELAKAGTTTGKFDTVAAMEAARQLGIGGPNFAQVAFGAAQMSNITPGIGVEGSMRAFGAVQQARNVNMLRGIGIRIRGEDGSMKPMPQIIDEIWAKLNREKMGNEPITAQDVQISLQPGNALASMLDQYFGNDPLLRKQVEDGLMLKARSGGARFAGRDMKKLAEEYGATTPAVSSLSQRITESTKTLQQAAPAMADAFTAANRIVSQITGVMNLIDRFTGMFTGLSAIKAGTSTLMSGGPGNIIGGIMNFAANIPFLGALLPGKADGGPVGGKMPYIVGEQGPELFVPKQDGVIIPNHEINRNNPFRHEGGEVHNRTHNAPDTRPSGAGKIFKSEEEMRKILQQAGFEGEGLANAMKIAKAESNYRPWAWNPHGGDLSYGLFQINMLGDLMDERLGKTWKAKDGSTFKLNRPEDLYDPLTNAKVAYHMSQKGYNWSQWSTKGVLGGGSAGGSANAGEGGSGVTESKGFEPGEKFSMSKFFSGAENSNKNLLSEFFKGFTSFATPSQKTQAQTNATTYNYGGVTVNLTGGTNPEANAAALKAALANTETLSKAANN